MNNFQTINGSVFYFGVFITLTFLASSRLMGKLIPAQTKNTDHCIEGLRGLACILVFINHSAWVLPNNEIFNNIIDYSSFISFGNFGSVGVEIFFCITGLLFSSKIKTVGFDASFYIKRIKRLAPAYIAISTLVLAIFIIENFNRINFIRDSANILSQVYGFGFFGSGITTPDFKVTSLNVVTWTLPYEWKFYAIIPFLSVLLVSRKYLILAVTFGLVVGYIDLMSDNVLWVYFIVGYLSSYVAPSKHKPARLVGYILMMASLYLALMYSGNQYGYIRMFLVSAFFISCIYIRPAMISYRPLSLIGTVSYSVYLSHQLIMNLATRCAALFFDPIYFDRSNLLVLNLVSIVFTMLISIASYRWVEHRFSK